MLPECICRQKVTLCSDALRQASERPNGHKLLLRSHANITQSFSIHFFFVLRHRSDSQSLTNCFFFSVDSYHLRIKGFINCYFALIVTLSFSYLFAAETKITLRRVGFWGTHSLPLQFGFFVRSGLLSRLNFHAGASLMCGRYIRKFGIRLCLNQFRCFSRSAGQQCKGIFFNRV